MEKSLTVVKSNSLVQASYRLSLDEQRLILSCIGQIDSKSDLDLHDGFKVTAKEFSQYSGVDIKSAYQQLKAATKDLYERSVTFYDEDTNDILITRWVSAIKYNHKQGQVELYFARGIIPLVSQIKSHFTKYKIEHISNLTSIHAIRIYELCLQYISIGSREMLVDELKFYLGLEESYQDFKTFNRDVLKKSIEQINKYTDIKISLDPIRKDRRIVSLRFKIESKVSRSHKVSKQKSEKKLKELGDQLSFSQESLSNIKESKPKFKLIN